MLHSILIENVQNVKLEDAEVGTNSVKNKTNRRHERTVLTLRLELITSSSLSLCILQKYDVNTSKPHSTKTQGNCSFIGISIQPRRNV